MFGTQETPHDGGALHIYGHAELITCRSNPVCVGVSWEKVRAGRTFLQEASLAPAVGLACDILLKVNCLKFGLLLYFLPSQISAGTFIWECVYGFIMKDREKQGPTFRYLFCVYVRLPEVFAFYLIRLELLLTENYTFERTVITKKQYVLNH